MSDHDFFLSKSTLIESTILPTSLDGCQSDLGFPDLGVDLEHQLSRSLTRYLSSPFWDRSDRLASLVSWSTSQLFFLPSTITKRVHPAATTEVDPSWLAHRD